MDTIYFDLFGWFVGYYGLRTMQKKSMKKSIEILVQNAMEV